MLRGHAIECRINAEDPRPRASVPVRGRIDCLPPARRLRCPGGHPASIAAMSYPALLRFPMVAKLIVHAPTRLEAIRRMRRALEEFIVEGVDTKHPPAYI